MKNSIGNGRIMMTTAACSRKDKFLYGALTVIAGVLTVVALVCVILFHTSAGFGIGMSTGQRLSASGLQDKIKVESHSTKGAATYQGSPDSNNQLNSDAAGGGSGDVGSGVNVASSGSTVAGSASSGGAASGNVLLGGPNNVGAGGGTAGNVGGDSSQPNVVTVGNGGSGGSGSGGGANPGSNSNGGGANPSTAAPDYRLKSACFGGAGHCYVGE